MHVGLQEGGVEGATVGRDGAIVGKTEGKTVGFRLEGIGVGFMVGVRDGLKDTFSSDLTYILQIRFQVPSALTESVK